MLRLLFLAFMAGVAAYFTVPDRAAHEAKASELLESYEPPVNGAGLSLDDIVGYVRGMMVGQGRYESRMLYSKYSVDLPGASYVECLGAFMLVRCEVREPGS